MPFQPGQSGNPGGRTKHRPFRDALRMEEALAAEGKECTAKKGSLRYIARQALIRAAENDAAMREVADRLDGKVPQAIVGDDEHDPVRVETPTDDQRAKALAAFMAKQGEGS